MHSCFIQLNRDVQSVLESITQLQAAFQSPQKCYKGSCLLAKKESFQIFKIFSHYTSTPLSSNYNKTVYFLSNSLVVQQLLSVIGNLSGEAYQINFMLEYLNKVYLSQPNKVFIMFAKLELNQSCTRATYMTILLYNWEFQD